MGRKSNVTTMVNGSKQTSTGRSPPQSRKSSTTREDLSDGKADPISKDEVKKQTPIIEHPPQSPMATKGGDFSGKKADPTSKVPHHVNKRKNLKSIATIRRSQRIKKTNDNKEIEPVVEEIDDTSESEKELEPLDKNKSPIDSSDEEKEEGNHANMKYKSMYISSQKKIQDLLEENKELKKNTEHILGKVEMIEKQNNIYEEVMTVIGSLSKMNENLYTQLKERVSPDTTEVEGSDEGRKRSRK